MFLYLDDAYDYARGRKEPMLLMTKYVLSRFKNHILLDAYRTLALIRDYLVR